MFPPSIDLAVFRDPVLLEVGDQRGAEVAVRLLERVCGEITAEQVERFLRHAKRAPVSRRAHHARSGELLDDALDGGVHLRWRDDLVADQPPPAAVALEGALG